ncbi:CocE/NonD family hydrolase [Nocardioides mesophilus]|uniref:CocE/NonD family hydrolase n=1 Tax=Nocardioides mesophilus TaxID=433659 RepID=A0A7G9REA6_9ACTN|nr:CocE/NonD family hydrolase [Nocardioides mesophilus]QNN53931.1 CocE/NonD family hydrolase [Nocardioides mesophilus]
MAATELTLRRNAEMRLPSGEILRADIWIPAGEGPFPTLLQRLPYDKSSSFMTQSAVGMEIVRALDLGFAVVVQDTRGRFTSEGDFEPFAHEAADGAAAVSWVRDQDFSNGQVCTYGASYIGATQMLLAQERPAGLVAMAPQVTTGDYYENWTYRSGALQLGFILLWIMESLAPSDVVRRELDGTDRGVQLLAQLLSDPAKAMEILPVRSGHLKQLAPYADDWLAHPTRDDYWEEMNPSRRYGDMEVPALHIAGWNDLFLEGSLNNYVGMRTGSATSDARDGQYLIVGPWSHGNMSDWQGDAWLGYAAHSAVLDLTGRQLEFFSAAVAGRRPEMPRVTYFTTGTNDWHEAEDWPLPGVVETPLYLGSGDAGPSTLTYDPPVGEAAPRAFVSDPLDPVPTIGGATFLPGLLVARNSGHKDQTSVENRDDVLIYTSELLTEPCTVTGPVVLELWASSSAVDCDWTGRLTDVDADGVSVGIIDGILRSRYRAGARPAPLTPGAPELFTITLGSISHTFGAGHRIRLQVASSNFPRFDRNPQSMVDPATATIADFVTAEQRVFHDAARPSRLLLPIV